MESDALFNQKIYLTSSDINLTKRSNLDAIILNKLKENLEGKCSEHGYVVKDSVKILSRSLGEIENARFTGDFIFHVKTYARVINSGEGIKISGRVERKNKMGILVNFKNAIRVQLPRDLHIGNMEFDKIELGNIINVELRKSQFQIRDLFILANGIYIDANDTDKFANGIRAESTIQIVPNKTNIPPPVPPPTPVTEEEEAARDEGADTGEAVEAVEAAADVLGAEDADGADGVEESKE